MKQMINIRLLEHTSFEDKIIPGLAMRITGRASESYITCKQKWVMQNLIKTHNDCNLGH